MKMKTFDCILKSCFIGFILILFCSSHVFAEEDKCGEIGITVKNMTMLDLWYKKDGGDCTIWVHDHVITIKPDNTFEIFSDLECKEFYCEENPTYDVYKTVDEDGNCMVRILPDCNLSDI
jgi:hypothetical protein